MNKTATSPTHEDNHTDVIRKAMRGLGISERDLAVRSGLTPSELDRVLAWPPRWEAADELPPLIFAVAKALHLSPRPLEALALNPLLPNVHLPKGLAYATSDFEGMAVNAFLVWDEISGQAAMFDTGAEASHLLDLLNEKNLQLRFLFATHGHGDHIFDAERVVEKTGAKFLAHPGEHIDGAASFDFGEKFSLGHLSIETRRTAGHSPAGTSYVILGLEVPVAVVGDALFCCSIGGPKISYQQSLGDLQEAILPLPSETVVCPGHGPVTTLGFELENNPFLADN